jgi:hypothetical protein
MILALALSVCLLGSCSSPVQETPDAVLNAPAQDQSAATVPTQEITPAPTEPIPTESAVSQEPEVPEEPSEPLYEIPSGVWLAGTDLGYSNYYHFDAQEQSGSYVSLEYGLGMDFTYDGSGNELVFSLDSHDSPVAATVEQTGEDEFTLVWEDSLPETLTYVGEGTLEDFPFYSNAELAELAGEHYARLTEEEIPELSGTLTNEDNTVTVQLYDNLGDHNSTAAWYIVDRFTAEATNLLTGEEFALEESEAEFPTFPEEHIFLEQTEFVSDNNSNL